MKRTAVINVVGLTDALIGEHTPRIRDFAARGDHANIVPVFPAVTCTAQATYLTGAPPRSHGVVGNGWYNRELAEVQFWKQANQLVRGRKVWEDLRERDPKFTCAKLFWWFNMYSTADFSITPRPMYPADGRKVFDIYTHPSPIRHEIQRDLGAFPFATFWGPAAGIDSPQGRADAASRWIAAAAKWIENQHQPSLNLIYLPHLDYNLQRHGPYATGDDARKPTKLPRPEMGPPKFGPPGAGASRLNPAIVPDLRAIDAIVGDLIDFFREKMIRVVLLSEYGIVNVDTPIHLNRLFRTKGWLQVRNELGLELLDAGASDVFAVPDHQVAHIYVKRPALIPEVRELLAAQAGVSSILGAEEKAAAGIDHPRAGDLIAVAVENAWFTYYYWLQDLLAPDFARTVDIHRKPGYDPAELFLDPEMPLPKLRIAWRLLQKKLGFRMLMNVVPLNAALVKGSHGRQPKSVADYPVMIAEKNTIPGPRLQAMDVYHVLKRFVMD